MPSYYFSNPYAGAGISNLAEALTTDGLQAVRAGLLGDQRRETQANTNWINTRDSSDQAAMLRDEETHGARRNAAAGIADSTGVDPRVAQALAFISTGGNDLTNAMTRLDINQRLASPALGDREVGWLMSGKDLGPNVGLSISDREGIASRNARQEQGLARINQSAGIFEELLPYLVTRPGAAPASSSAGRVPMDVSAKDVTDGRTDLIESLKPVLASLGVKGQAAPELARQADRLYSGYYQRTRDHAAALDLTVRAMRDSIQAGPATMFGFGDAATATLDMTPEEIDQLLAAYGGPGGAPAGAGQNIDPAAVQNLANLFYEQFAGQPLPQGFFGQQAPAAAPAGAGAPGAEPMQAAAPTVDPAAAQAQLAALNLMPDEQETVNSMLAAGFTPEEIADAVTVTRQQRGSAALGTAAAEAPAVTAGSRGMMANMMPGMPDLRRAGRAGGAAPVQEDTHLPSQSFTDFLGDAFRGAPARTASAAPPAPAAAPPAPPTANAPAASFPKFKMGADGVPRMDAPPADEIYGPRTHALGDALAGVFPPASDSTYLGPSFEMDESGNLRLAQAPTGQDIYGPTSEAYGQLDDFVSAAIRTALARLLQGRTFATDVPQAGQAQP